MESPLKLLQRHKSSGHKINSNKMTPKHHKRSASKALMMQAYDDEDCENDFAYSSGKNSRRKSSVVRAQLMREHDEEAYFNGALALRAGSDTKQHLFESNSKKASSAMRCLYDNETDGICNNAPKKGARYL